MHSGRSTVHYVLSFGERRFLEVGHSNQPLTGQNGAKTNNLPRVAAVILSVCDR